jgi:hypothetical protein
MSGSDRRPYLTATVLDQDLLDDCHDNLECRLEAVVEIESPTGTIYASDRNKYVGSTFYEALLNFPVIGRTVGEWLASELQFSVLRLELSNVDGRFNEFLPGGTNYGGWIGKSVEVKIGLAEQASTYKTIFKGKITDIGGFKRTVKSVIVIARDDYDRLNQSFPQTVLTENSYPKIEQRNIGKILPIIYGDWTVENDPAPAVVPAYVVNGNDPFVTFAEKALTSISGPATPAVFTLTDHDLDDDDPVHLSTSGALPNPFSTGTTYYVKVTSVNTFELATTPGGASINSTSAGSGDHKVVADPAASRRKPRLRVSENALTSFDTGEVYLKRGETYYNVPSGSITLIGGNNNEFDVDQGGTWVDGGPYEFTSSDIFLVNVVGKDLGAYSDNLVWQARDILLTYGAAVAGDFDTSWATYRDKSTPAQSAISAIKSRVWVGSTQSALTYALSMLEQVRLEAFINRDLKIQINSLHFEDWNSSPSHTVKNWDVVRNSFQTSVDERNNFNAAQGKYNYHPDVEDEVRKTPVYRNSAAITQVNKRIAKEIVFPNLYVATDVVNQVTEILRLASSSLEIVDTQLTWRAMLKDIGEFSFVDVQIGSTILENVPAMWRSVGYDPVGLKVVSKKWLMALVPYPGYTPGYAGTVGGYSATISEET